MTLFNWDNLQSGNPITHALKSTLLSYNQQRKLFKWSKYICCKERKKKREGNTWENGCLTFQRPLAECKKKLFETYIVCIAARAVKLNKKTETGNIENKRQVWSWPSRILNHNVWFLWMKGRKIKILKEFKDSICE